MDAAGRAWRRPLVLAASEFLNVERLADRLKAAAISRGFAAVGIAPAARLEEGGALRRWLEAGYQASMTWMANPEVRENPEFLLEGARSVIVVGMDCYSAVSLPSPGEGRIARYALGADYHRVMSGKLKLLLSDARAMGIPRGRAVVDSHPLLERALARRAGMGWFGKNSCLVSRRHASWLLLGELIVDVELAPDSPEASRCGTCSRCIDSCPTGAIVSPGVVDANRCIAYLTIEHRGPIPAELRPLIGDRLFGCDGCQEVCPWNRFPGGSGGSGPRLSSVQPVAELLSMSEDEFRTRFAGTPVRRTGRERMARNAAVVAGNRGGAAVTTAVVGALRDSDSVVRGHAAWALGRLGETRTLRRRLAVEDDPAVREEINLALSFRGGS